MKGLLNVVSKKYKKKNYLKFSTQLRCLKGRLLPTPQALHVQGATNQREGSENRRFLLHQCGTGYSLSELFTLTPPVLISTKQFVLTSPTPTEHTHARQETHTLPTTYFK